MNRRETRAAHACKAAGLLRDADDELLDVFRGVPEHLRAAGIWIDFTRAVDRLDRAIRIAATAFERAAMKLPVKTKVVARLGDTSHLGGDK